LKDLRPDYRYDLKVSVNVLDEQGRATYVEGEFELGGEGFAFKGIAMEGYGGPNFSAILPDETQGRLRELGYERESIDEIIVEIQRKIMEGEATMNLPPPQKPESKQPTDQESV
jgi:hypothetical protein